MDKTKEIADFLANYPSLQLNEQKTKVCTRSRQTKSPILRVKLAVVGCVRVDQARTTGQRRPHHRIHKRKQVPAFVESPRPEKVQHRRLQRVLGAKSKSKVRRTDKVPIGRLTSWCLCQSLGIPCSVSWPSARSTTASITYKHTSRANGSKKPMNYVSAAFLFETLSKMWGSFKPESLWSNIFILWSFNFEKRRQY